MIAVLYQGREINEHACRFACDLGKRVRWDRMLSKISGGRRIVISIFVGLYGRGQVEDLVI